VHTRGKAVMTFANLGWTLPPILTGLCEAAGPVAELPAAQAEWIGSRWQARFPGSPGPRPIPEPPA